MFPFMRAICTNGYLQGQEIDRIFLYRIPAEGIPEGVADGAILTSLEDCGFD